MIWCLLFGLTVLVALLPMLPALLEWWRPSDIEPLFIDKDDALDPPYLARSFALGLTTALALRRSALGRSPIVSLPPGAVWAFDPRERRDAVTRRVWDLQGDAELPQGMSFLAEVASRMSLRAAPGGVYRALWVRDDLSLPAACTVLRWAHAARIDVGTACDLPGRVTADTLITVGAGTGFGLLHAPLVRFAPTPGPAREPRQAACGGAAHAWPATVSWHAETATGRCAVPLVVDALAAWSGDLVCAADLVLGAGCQVQGSLKSHGALTLGAGCVVQGSIVASGPITLMPGCTVRGAIVSEASIVLGPGCTAGAPGHPCTVAAPQILADAGVEVHGTVWAGSRGHCNAAERSTAEPNRLHPADARLTEAIA